MPRTRFDRIFCFAAAAFLLAACGDKAAEKMAGKWIGIANGETVEFTDKEIIASDGRHAVESYKLDGDKVIIVSDDGGSKRTMQMTFYGDDRVCPEADLMSCLVRPHRARKLEGIWSPDNSASNVANVEFTDVAVRTGVGAFPVEDYKFDGNKATIIYRDDRRRTTGSAPGALTLKVEMQGDDKICIDNDAHPCMTRLKKN